MLVANRPSTLFRAELKPLVQLALPVVLAELGWMAMGVVDTMMVGSLGPEAIGAVAMGNVIFNTVGILVIGFLLGLDTLIAQAFGAGDQADCDHSLRQGLWLAALVAPVLFAVMQLFALTLPWWGIELAVSRLAQPFSSALAWSVFPLGVYAVFRRYLQSMNVVRPVMVALVSANLINFAGNWLLIHGHWGAPQMGVTGSAVSTIAARIYMAAVLLLALPRGVLKWERPDWTRIEKLFLLGVPAAGHIFLEIAGFGLATALAGQFPAFALAAHEIVLNNAALTYMVPLGISSAAAVRVGQAMGRGDRLAARVSGWTAIALGAGFMACSGIAMMLAPRYILGLYTTDRAVLAVGIPLIGMAAAFQLFDGVQVVATGALRGLGDTKMAFVANVAGYLVVGLPIGAALCFVFGWQVFGLWVGLTLGLMMAAAVLLTAWIRRSSLQ
ncbi:MAG: MATE family efflux transporter [Acidobacteria bacterium]|nr:MATE family efflux transporter [Acidobacteriota bacterium]